MVNERAAQKYGFEVGMRAPLSGLVSFGSWDARPLGEATIVGIVRTPFDLVDDPSTESFAIAGPDFLEGDWGGSPAPERSCGSTCTTAATSVPSCPICRRSSTAMYEVPPTC